MKEKWKMILSALKPGRVAMTALILMCISFGMMSRTGGDSANENIEGMQAAPSPGQVWSASETGGSITKDCEIIQSMGFSRCGHSVTRRIHPQEHLIGSDFSMVQQYYDLWQVESFSPDRIEMQREIALFCPMHWVLTANEAGEIVISRNVYGDGMGVMRTFSRNLSDFDEETQGKLMLGMGFDEEEDAIAWLDTH